MYNTILMDDYEEEYIRSRNIEHLEMIYLRAKAKEITRMMSELKSFIDDMFDTSYEANGVGLAALQVEL